jgi:hypothetical protein
MDQQVLASFRDELEKISTALADRTLGSVAGGLGDVVRGLGGNVVRGAKSLWTGARKGSEAMAQHFEAGGHPVGRLAATTSRLAPYAGAIYLGDKAFNSTPVQSVKQTLLGPGQGAYYQ